MNKVLDVIAWTMVGLVVVLIVAIIGWGLWELLKWFFSAGIWKFALAILAWGMVTRTLRWAFCRVTKDPVPFWSSMGFFE